MAGPRGSLSPHRGNIEKYTVTAQFSIGASGAHTRVLGAGMSVARTAAGKYTITFTEWGPKLIDLQVTHWAAANAPSLQARPTVDSFTATASSATALYETYGGVNDDTQTELANGDKVTITAVFLKSA